MRDLEQAFQEAFEKHSDELFRHCVLRYADRERALELTQECFLKTWEYLARGEKIGQLRPFLYRVLNNLIVDEYRKRKTQSLDALMENEETATYVEGSVLKDDFDLLEDAMVQFDAKRALECVSKLPDMYRTVLVLRYIDGLSPSEIALSLKESENVVSVRLHRAIRKVRELLTSEFGGEPEETT